MTSHVIPHVIPHVILLLSLCMQQCVDFFASVIENIKSDSSLQFILTVFSDVTEVCVLCMWCVCLCVCVWCVCVCVCVLFKKQFVMFCFTL